MPCQASRQEGFDLTRREHLLRCIALRVPTVVLREPFTILTLGFLALASGLMVLRLVPYPVAITGSIGGGPVAWLWALILAVGSVLGLAGLLRRLWWLESFALWLVVTALVVHAIGALEEFGGQAIISVAFSASLAAAGAIKALAVAAANAVSDFRLNHDGQGGHAG